jgi:AcrR family transcriptional regulator
MTRPLGARDPQYDERRAALLDKIIPCLATRNQTKPSARQIARAVGVTVPTLLHYFGDRDAIVVAALAHWHDRGRMFLEAASIPTGTFEQSIAKYAANLLIGLTQFGMASFLAAGFVESLLDDHNGPAFVDHALEPIIMALAGLLSTHQERGDMRDGDTRFAAISFISPILVLCHHQHQLSGAKNHPTDLESYVNYHVTAFVRAHKV